MYYLSTIRNQGIAIGYSLLALKSSLKGLIKLQPNTDYIKQELDNHWEILTEAIQTILKRNGLSNAYEILKTKTRGHSINEGQFKRIIEQLPVNRPTKDELLELTPHIYTGLAKQLVEKYLENN